MTFSRLAVLPALLGIMALAPSQPTARHLRLTGSWPAKDSTVVAPTEIKLWYSQRPSLPLARVTLTGPTGNVTLGELTLAAADSAPIVAPITGPTPPGKYTVAWRTAGNDGHVIRGEFGFAVK
jgi:methionine-rich copper-binding protein CopC